MVKTSLSPSPPSDLPHFHALPTSCKPWPLQRGSRLVGHWQGSSASARWRLGSSNSLGACPVHRGVFSGILGVYLLDASSTSPVTTIGMSPDIGRRPLRCKNAMFRTIAFIILNLQEPESPCNDRYT